MALRSISVSQLSAYIKRLMASDPILSGVIVRGEISKLVRHSSGHLYFTLKDEGSRLSCFLPSDRAASLRYELSDGMEILAIGSVSLYERGGYYSLNVRDVEVEGEGALSRAFENLKRKLEAEGLFDPSRKKKLPASPKRIAVVTSPTGAAVRDIISTLRRRDPLADVIVYPCLVQGEGAAASIAAAIEDINRGGVFSGVDLMIVGRGGGSAEDLWAFNEEIVARAIYASQIPVISAVGHENDYLISDMAADVRAATPTAAAELASPDIAQLRYRMELSSPGRMFLFLDDSLASAQRRAERAFESAGLYAVSRIESDARRLEALKAQLDSAHPLKALEAGFVYATDAAGRMIRSAAEALPGQELTLHFADGEAEVTVKGA
ncbi:MAG: exodeoxyribonuclease VII large subunit [Firmicutes bacterium]|nr:exodeoxyribonuclease VII large subunit [Bacillota bacterium]